MPAGERTRVTGSATREPCCCLPRKTVENRKMREGADLTSELEHRHLLRCKAFEIIISLQMCNYSVVMIIDSVTAQPAGKHRFPQDGDGEADGAARPPARRS